MKRTISKDRLKEILHYDENTGIFTRLKSGGGRVAGSIAGGAHSEGYSCISIDNKRYFSHRLAWLYMTGNFPENIIDHINNVRSDNRFCNLREADKIKNGRNSKVRKDSKSGIKGVQFLKDLNKWEASLFKGGKRIHLGLFETAELASVVRVRAAKEYHGEFYRA